MKSIFISATDTNVGKTWVGTAMAAYLRSKKINVGVFKPCESGCLSDSNGKLIPADALLLKENSGSEDSLDEINPYRFAAPVAPGLAASLEGKKIDLEKIKEQFLALQKRHEVMIVEGAGGLLVPLTSQESVLHLIQKLQIPVLLIARNGLGTLNHTLLSLASLQSQKIEVVGVVLNQTQAEADFSSEYNRQVLKEWTSVRVLGTFPFFKRPVATQALIQESERLFSGIFF